MVIFELALCSNHENSLVYVWIKLFAQWLELNNVKFKKNFVHHSAGHFLALADIFVLLFDFCDVFQILYFLDVAVLQSQFEAVSNIEKLLGELGDGELLSVIDLLPVPLDGVVVFGQLVDEFNLHFLELLLKICNLGLIQFNGLILVVDQLLYFHNVFFRQIDLLTALPRVACLVGCCFLLCCFLFSAILFLDILSDSICLLCRFLVLVVSEEHPSVHGHYASLLSAYPARHQGLQLVISHK